MTCNYGTPLIRITHAQNWSSNIKEICDSDLTNNLNAPRIHMFEKTYRSLYFINVMETTR